MQSSTKLRARIMASAAPVILVAGDKGGVGKSFTARAIAAYLRTLGFPIAGFDCEPRLTPILSRHADEAREFRRTRKPTWQEYVDQRAQQGCPHAIALKRQSTRVELAPMLQKGQRLDVDVSYAISRGSRDQDRSRENFAPVIEDDEEQEDKEALAKHWKSQKGRDR